MNLLLYLKTFLLLYSAFMNLMKDLCQDYFSESKSILFRWINQKINWNLEIGLFEWKLWKIWYFKTGVYILPVFRVRCPPPRSKSLGMLPCFYINGKGHFCPKTGHILPCFGNLLTNFYFYIFPFLFFSLFTVF